MTDFCKTINEMSTGAWAFAGIVAGGIIAGIGGIWKYMTREKRSSYFGPRK